MPSIFSRIVSGEIPSYKIAETENCYAFLDIFPLVKGHTLVIPKKEVDYLFDLDDALLSELNVFAKKVALAIGKSVPCVRVGVVVLGLEVPHAHIHLIPLNTESDINFSRRDQQISLKQLPTLALQLPLRIFRQKCFPSRIAFSSFCFSILEIVAHSCSQTVGGIEVAWHFFDFK
jgi:histidine triad (HIT) family protein